MTYRVTGLDPAQFAPLFGLSDEELATRGARRRTVTAGSGIPDRIEVREAREGETVILLNHVHQPANNAYHASHAIFVLEGASEACNVVDNIPEVMKSRLISLRAFGIDHELVAADVAPGAQLEPVIERFFDDRSVSYLQAHYAKPGCYAARIDRA
jgi:hypothetical protein